jgi:hypothetical protein
MAKKNKFKELREEVENLKLLNSYYAGSSPRNLSITGSISLKTISRDSELLERQEMYEDTFTREMVKVIIVRAIGTTHDNIKPFDIVLKQDANIDKKMKKIINNEFKYLVDLISKNLIDITLDSQFFGDGYARIHSESKKGVTKILRNFSTTPFNITPIVSNQGKTVAYEVGSGRDILKGKNSFVTHNNSRQYVAPIFVGRLNSAGNGITTVTTEQLATINNIDLFNSEETIYEDGIYGGVMEGVYKEFLGYEWAIKSLANTRIASSVLERFIIHSLNSVNADEKEALKKGLENQIKSTLSSIKDKISTKSPGVLMANHIIPTTNDGTNGISIQESSPNFQGFQNIEDIMIHIRRFIGAIGFNIEMTPFAGMSIGGGEKDGVVQNSLQMDAQGTQIRSAIREYVFDIIKIHFIAKFDIEIDLSQIEVNFRSVINHAQQAEEAQTAEALMNDSQYNAILTDLKEKGYPDTPDVRKSLYAKLSRISSISEDYKENVINIDIDMILSKPKEEEF